MRTLIGILYPVYQWSIGQNSLAGGTPYYICTVCLFYSLPPWGQVLMNWSRLNMVWVSCLFGHRSPVQPKVETARDGYTQKFDSCFVQIWIWTVQCKSGNSYGMGKYLSGQGEQTLAANLGGPRAPLALTGGLPGPAGNRPLRLTAPWRAAWQISMRLVCTFLQFQQFGGWACDWRATMAWTLVVAIIPILLLYLWKKVSYHRKKEYAWLPQLPPSLLWGHLSTLDKLLKASRPNIHIGWL